MGSTTIAALIIIAVHLLVCMMLCLLHHVGVLKVDGLLLPFMALIPLWGPLSVALMHSRAVLRGGRRIPAGLQELKVEDREQLQHSCGRPYGLRQHRAVGRGADRGQSTAAS